MINVPHFGCVCAWGPIEGPIFHPIPEISSRSTDISGPEGPFLARSISFTMVPYWESGIAALATLAEELAILPVGDQVRFSQALDLINNVL